MAVTARPTLAPMPSLANELPDCPTTKWSVDNIDIAAEQVSCVNVFRFYYTLYRFCNIFFGFEM